MWNSSVMLFKPLPGTDGVPVVAFRGTEPTDLGDEKRLKEHLKSLRKGS